MNGTTSQSQPLIPGSVNHGCGKDGTICWILTQSTYSRLETCLNPARYGHLAGTVTEPPERPFNFLSGSLLSGDGEHQKTSELHGQKAIVALYIL